MQIHKVLHLSEFNFPAISFHFCVSDIANEIVRSSSTVIKDTETLEEQLLVSYR